MQKNGKFLSPGQQAAAKSPPGLLTGRRWPAKPFAVCVRERAGVDRVLRKCPETLRWSWPKPLSQTAPSALCSLPIWSLRPPDQRGTVAPSPIPHHCPEKQSASRLAICTLHSLKDAISMRYNLIAWKLLVFAHIVPHFLTTERMFCIPEMLGIIGSRLYIDVKNLQKSWIKQALIQQPQLPPDSMRSPDNVLGTRNPMLGVQNLLPAARLEEASMGHASPWSRDGCDLYISLKTLVHCSP